MFSNTGPEGEFPVRLDLVPGKLSAQVYLHDVKSVRRKIPCWTYVTDGLRERGQKEVVITLSREEDENASDFPRAPLKFFSHLYEFSEGGESVDVGDVTQFEGDGFMGRAGIVYAEPESLYGLELPSFSLAAVLLTEDELQAVHAFGATRVLALLGKAARHYPYPAWSDRSRPGCLVWEPGHLEPTVAAPPGSRRTRLSGCFLALVPDQEEDCSEIVEDGMVVSFTDSSWLAVKGALETQAPITIPSTSGSLHFTLSWRQLL
jgi:hypothetical protein